jgi:hypothetical protein
VARSDEAIHLCAPVKKNDGLPRLHGRLAITEWLSLSLWTVRKNARRKLHRASVTIQFLAC